jgi:hypothetical protein
VVRAKHFIAQHHKLEGLSAEGIGSSKWGSAAHVASKLAGALNPAVQEARDDAHSFKQLQVQQLVALQTMVWDREWDIKECDREVRKLQDQLADL